MSPSDLESWDKEHYEMLEGAAPERFMVKHYVSVAELQSEIGRLYDRSPLK